MIVNSYYTQDIHGPYELHSIGDLHLEEGETLKDCRLAVATHGTLNAAKDNVVLVPTWYSGTSKMMSDVYVGSGHALDPSKYFIVIVNQIGNGLSSSPHNTAGAKGMANFPKVRISDDVRAQHKLLTEVFGIEKLALVVGGSMGAQQTYEWAVRYPDMVQRAAPIAGTAQNTLHDKVFADILIEAITSDPGFENGTYSSPVDVLEGLTRHAKIWSVMGWSTEFYAQKRHEQLGFASLDAFVSNFMVEYFRVMDPNALLSMAWKWQRGDVARNTNGNLAAALGRIKAKTFVMPIDADMFFPPIDCERECQMITGAEFRPITSIDGHLALFGADANFMPQVDRHLKDLLNTPVG